MLYLVGIGLGENDFTLAGVEACKKSSKAYIDTYTTFISNPRIQFIEGQIGKRLLALSRKDLEDSASKLIKESAKQDIAVLVGGDPLLATTHKILFIEAKRQNVPTKVLHSSSIVPAMIGESCLDFYRFGEIATVPRWSEHYKPVSFYEKIARNISSNLHSVLLFDFDTKELSISPKEAADVLEEAEKYYKKGIITSNLRLFVFCNLSLDKEFKAYVYFDEFKHMDLHGLISAIIPARLSDIEKETIESIY
ncbi:MAG: diphthine synthase [Candidatus Micrarchaeaceae archaeon]